MKRIEDGKGNLRDMFIVAPGYKLVYGDYSQIELVTLAIQSGDNEMLEVFKSGVDIHKATAAAFLECELDEVVEFNRSIGKNVNFGRVYGSTDGWSLMKLTYMDMNGKERPITEAMVKRGFASLDDRFPSAARYFTDTVNEISSNNGLYTTRFGRMKRMTGTMNSPNEWARKEAERQAVNGSIQSPANSVTVRCLTGVDAHLIDLIEKGEMTEEEIFLILTVHDSGAWEVKDHHVEWFVPKVKEIASRKVPELDDFQFTMKVGVGDSWSEAELNAK
jgi:DNA polymerase-1